ncbi:MAG: Uma2 family endonuclease [Isosphaeraceae bacterium]
MSVAKYLEMGRLGILTKRDRVELIDGILVSKMTKNPPHQVAYDGLIDRFPRLLPPGWFCRGDCPLRLATSVLEPDFQVVRGSRADYLENHHRPEDVALVIEVSDSSYAEDLKLIPIYAEARIPTYWIVNIPGNRIEIYSDPTGPDMAPAYRVRREFGRGDSAAIELPDREPIRLPVAEILPAQRP